MHAAVGGKARRALAQAGGARDSREMTRRGDGAAPDYAGRQDGATSERIGQGAVGVLELALVSGRAQCAR
jgi:hypothetical protein